MLVPSEETAPEPVMFSMVRSVMGMPEVGSPWRSPPS
jgi:hypothetical protein